MTEPFDYRMTSDPQPEDFKWIKLSDRYEQVFDEKDTYILVSGGLPDGKSVKLYNGKVVDIIERVEGVGTFLRAPKWMSTDEQDMPWIHTFYVPNDQVHDQDHLDRIHDLHINTMNKVPPHQWFQPVEFNDKLRVVK